MALALDRVARREGGAYARERAEGLPRTVLPNHTKAAGSGKPAAQRPRRDQHKMGKGRGKRSVLAQKAQTIEEIWESVSRTKSADLNPPPSKIVLTPRSAEACLRHGLNPEILRIRPLDSFDVKGVDPTVQRLRHETYTQRRFEMMRLVRAERKRLVAQEARDADLAASGQGGGATITPQQLIAAQAKQNATFIEEEEKRMRKMSVTQRGNS